MRLLFRPFFSVTELVEVIVVYTVTSEGRKKENSKFCTLPKFEILFFCPFAIIMKTDYFVIQ